MIKLLLVCFLALSAYSNTKVIMKTTMGEIEISLFDKKSPKSVKNFLGYVKSGFYKNTIFHRIIDNFMIQGGGFSPSLAEKKTRAPIENEATNKVSNDIGTVAMARTSVVNSATSQFFINVGNNTFLNNRGRSASAFGYAVFGKITKGMTVINRMKKVSTSKNGPFQNLPVKNVVITDVYIKK